MVLDRLILSLFDFKTNLIYPLIYQQPSLDNNNISLLINRKSSIFKLNRLIYLIMLCGG